MEAEPSTGPCLVEFGDGSAAIGTIEAGGENLILALGAYSTAKETPIPPKRWIVRIDGRGAEAHFKILGRAAPP